jgi:osmotically-inducible protein OsmY
MRRLSIAMIVIALALPSAGREPAPEGRALERRLRDDLRARSYLERGRIEVRVDGRDVTVAGKVPDALHRSLVRLVCENEPGVERVTDELVIDESLGPWRPSIDERDRIAATSARAALRSDRQLGLYTSLSVRVSGGAATVTGRVARIEHQRAAVKLLCELFGVEHVIDRIEVDPLRASRRSAPPLDMSATETELANAIDERIRADDLLRGSVLISTHVTGDQVILLGEAPDLVHHDAMVELARNVVVHRPAPRPNVTSQIVIGRKPPPPPVASPGAGGRD